jgi:hypothetical protein
VPYLREDESPTQAEREKMPEHLFGDPENKKYPLDTEEHVKAASSYASTERDEGRLSEAKYREIHARILQREKDLGIGEGAAKDCAGAPRADRVQRFDFASGGIESHHRETSQGGLIARTALTRTGIFEYHHADGSVTRELRHPDDVFAPASLDSLAHATVTDDHPGKVTPDNWRANSIGHVAGRPVKGGRTANGDDLVEQDVHIEHGPAIAKAERGDLKEASCGYTCKTDGKPGVWNGQAYDSRQSDITYNHVALGPRGWGRAGREVQMHLDSAFAVSVSGAAREDSTPSFPGMTEAEKAALEAAQKAKKDADEALARAHQDAKDAKTELDKLRADKAASDAKLAAAQAENEVLKLQAKQDSAIADAKVAAAIAEEKNKLAVRADCAKVFGAEWKDKGESSDTMRRAVIAKVQPEYKLDAVLAGKTSDVQAAIVEGIYPTVLAGWEKLQKAEADLRAALGQRTDGTDPADETAPDVMKAKKDSDAAGAKRFRPAKDSRRAKAGE